MAKESQKNKDALHEASLILQAPYKNTKKKILVAVNISVVVIAILHLAMQLISLGHLPSPARDLIMIPLIVTIHSFSLYYNLRLLTKGVPEKKRITSATAWASVLTLQLFALLSVHVNLNTAISFIFDFTFSIILIFICGTVLNKRVAIVWFGITVISLLVAYGNRGSSFEYNLMTKQEVLEYKRNLNIVPKTPEEKILHQAAKQRERQAEKEKIVPFKITLYFNIWIIFLLLAFLPSFFQANMIGQVLRSIPQAIKKIELAADEKNLLKKENVRMSMELDIEIGRAHV